MATSDQNPDEPDLWRETAAMKLHLGMLEMRDALANITWTELTPGLSQARIGSYQASVMFLRNAAPDIPTGWTWDLQRDYQIVTGDNGIADKATAQRAAEAAMRADYYR